MSGLELKSIMVRENSVRSGSFDSESSDSKKEIECSKDMRKVFTYKLFNDALRNKVVDKLKLNDNMVFAGFSIDSEFNVRFNNEHFSHVHELAKLKNSFLEGDKNYLSTVVNDRFWFTYMLNLDHKCDEIEIYVPSDKGFIVPKVKAVFVEYERWVTGCFFKKVHYRVIDGSEEED